jgi:hypothetical protein
MVVVAIRISLALKLFHYSKIAMGFHPHSKMQTDGNHLPDLDAEYKGKVAVFRFRNQRAFRGMKSSPGLASRSIIMALRPSSGLD